MWCCSTTISQHEAHKLSLHKDVNKMSCPSSVGLANVAPTKAESRPTGLLRQSASQCLFVGILLVKTKRNTKNSRALCRMIAQLAEQGWHLHQSVREHFLVVEVRNIINAEVAVKPMRHFPLARWSRSSTNCTS